MLSLGPVDGVSKSVGDVPVPVPVSAPAAAPADYRSAADELAMFAMKCHIASEDTFDVLPCSGDMWEPLRCNEATGKVEPSTVDSPVEPGVAKREVSFSTQMVRRAVSFIFEDNPNSPVHTRRSTPAVVA